MKIPALQSVTVEVLVDNFFDIFEPSRPGLVERVVPGRLKKPLLAAHGLAYLVTLHHQGKLSRILMDAANAPLPLFNNRKIFTLRAMKSFKPMGAGCSLPPPMPGKIIAQIATRPHKKMNQSEMSQTLFSKKLAEKIYKIQKEKEK